MEALYLNYAAVDPELTNSKCSYWQYRFDADTSMKMEALTAYMKDQPKLKKVYIIGQNYSHGQQVSKYTNEFKKKSNDDLYTTDIYPVFQALVDGFVRAKSTDPVKVAAVLEGMKFKSFNGDVELRKADHQIQQGLYIARGEKASAKYLYSPENTGYTLAPVKYYDAYVAVRPLRAR